LQQFQKQCLESASAKVQSHVQSGPLQAEKWNTYLFDEANDYFLISNDYLTFSGSNPDNLFVSISIGDPICCCTAHFDWK